MSITPGLSQRVLFPQALTEPPLEGQTAPVQLPYPEPTFVPIPELSSTPITDGVVTEWTDIPPDQSPALPVDVPIPHPPPGPP